jgi:hypothetical protein
VAVRCKTYETSGSLPLGVHCGLVSFRPDGKHCKIDGTGGGVNFIRVRSGRLPDGSQGRFVSLPDSVCKCLESDYPAIFNPLRRRRFDSTCNSNWTLGCLVTYCHAPIKWGGGEMSEPIGYTGGKPSMYYEHRPTVLDSGCRSQTCP